MTPWIQTYTGKQFDLRDPTPSMICIEDIAHSLSNLCRYVGHSKTFYSVAQHSVIVSYNCTDVRWGLMHDAAEAYIGDISRPLKTLLRDIKEIELEIMHTIANKFALPLPIPDEIETVDNILLATERLYFMEEIPTFWGIDYEDVEPLPLPINKIVAWTPQAAEQEFLRRFHELFPS